MVESLTRRGKNGGKVAGSFKYNYRSTGLILENGLAIIQRIASKSEGPDSDKWVLVDKGGEFSPSPKKR